MQTKLKNLTSSHKFLYLLSINLISIIIMKKIIAIILGLFSIFLISSYNHSNALSVADFTPALDKKIAKMKTTEEKVKFLQSFSNLLNSPRFKKHKNARLFADIREYSLNMLEVFEYELNEEQAKNWNKATFNKTTSNSFTQTAQSTPKLKLPHLSDNFSNIDEQKVRNAILSRHNEERKNVWSNPYNYNLDLEWSATTWANKIAGSHKTSNFHLRNNWDGYYNYNSILNRFSNLWINFPESIKWAASFSESIWYGSYNCSKSDCTQELITAIKKTWTNIIMKEKYSTSDRSHYNAAVMKHFTQMWVWIAIDKPNNRYYLVIHYGINF